MVSSENSHDWPYTRKLTGFVDLGKEKIEFGNNNAFGSSARIPAIYELKKDNEADYEICKYIKLKVDAMISKVEFICHHRCFEDKEEHYSSRSSRNGQDV